jgi:hypothetical protein
LSVNRTDALSERCDAVRHFGVNYGVDLDEITNAPRIESIGPRTRLIAPEAPTGYRYIHGTNEVSRWFDEAGRIDFYKSCRIYEPPAEVESATVAIEAGQEIVKVVFKNRLHSAVQGALPRDPALWDAVALRKETYRTTDNALLEYLYHVHRGGLPGDYQCSVKLGDMAAGSSLPFEPDNPFGSCYPHCFFVRLVPEPYDDGNDVWEKEDTRVLVDNMVQMEMYLRAMCEGYIDQATSMQFACKTTSEQLMDYSFENLCFEVFADVERRRRWFLNLPASLRDDKPQGFGPVPNSKFTPKCSINIRGRSTNWIRPGFGCRTSCFADSIPMGGYPSCPGLARVAWKPVQRSGQQQGGLVG